MSLLGCGNPLRIQRHDSLRDIIFQALLLDSRPTRREQRISGHSKERPGDVFNPTFTDGRPTYFDVSVCSPLNSSVSASSAGLQAEMLKDARHAASVEGVGGVFSPLVVEALGLWTPFARKTLQKIAARTTVQNGLPVEEAFHNLIQQLSVKLWSFNANKLLYHLSLMPSPPDWVDTAYCPTF